MPKLRNKPPKYRLHRASGRAVVSIGGKDIYLGEYQSSESHREYDRVIAEWYAAGRPTFAPVDKESGLVLSQVLVLFMRHAKEYYQNSDEADGFKYAIKPLHKLYGSTHANEFSPSKFKAVREEMVKQNWSRRYINKQCGRIRMVFKWATAEELVRGEVLHSLRSVAPLKYGRRSDVREAKPILPVSDDVVDATLPHLPEMVAAMVRIQRLTGARGGEICGMRGCDLNMSGETWTYSPAHHKTAHHGHRRTIYIGPKAQEILLPYLRSNLTEFIFQPALSERQRLAANHAARVTPASCGNRPGSNRVRHRRRPPANCYDSNTYARAIQRGCDRAYPPPTEIGKRDGETVTKWKKRLTARQHLDLKVWRKDHRWHPHQLRHTAATAWRAQFGSDTALTLLGDRSDAMLNVYAERDGGAAAAVAHQIG